MKTLRQFTARRDRIASGHIDHPDFEHLYLRRTWEVLGTARLYCIVIQSVVAKRPGSGAFRRLIDELHPTWDIMVEGVCNPYLREHLLCRGFTQDGFHLGLPNYYLLTIQELNEPCKPPPNTMKNFPENPATWLSTV